MIRKIVLDRIEKISEHNRSFSSPKWENIFISFDKNSVHITKHISEVNFSELSDEDLVRIFEYIIYLNNIERHHDQEVDRLGGVLH